MKAKAPYVILVLVAASMITFLVSPVGEAFAHASPVSYSPTPDTMFQEGQPLPSEVVIVFSERPDPVTSYIHVVDTQNVRVDNDDFTVTGDHNNRESMVTLDPASLADGIYTVSWRALSLDDGHITRGAFVFGVGDVAAIGETPPPAIGAEVQPVTATFDAILKGVLIVAEVAVVGAVVGHMILWRKFSRSAFSRDNQRLKDTEIAYSAGRRLVLLLMSSGIAIMTTGSALILLQAHTLSEDIGGTLGSTFVSLIFTPVGTVWILRMLVSIAIIVVSLLIYYSARKNKETVGPAAFPLLMVILVAGSLAIFSNSIVSHSAAAPFFPLVSAAVDWVHLMAVAVWIGGLFYIVTVLLYATHSKSESMAARRKDLDQNNRNKQHLNRINSFYFALLLPYFSLIATASLGVIGVTGLYLAWLHLQVPDSLFETEYGNILIIKLAAILPLVVLGGYHQLRVHKSMMNVAMASRNISGRGSIVTSSSSTTTTTNNNNPRSLGNGGKMPKKDDDAVSHRFGRTIKAESLVAIAVLIIASFLSTTAPPSLTAHHDQLGEEHADHMEGESIYITQDSVLDANVQVEISPFYAGYNHFIVTITEEDEETIAQNISNVIMTFTNREEGIGPIVQNMIPDLEGIFHLSGGFLSQPGLWDIRVTAQRVGAYDVNYRFEENLPAAPTSLGEVTEEVEVPEMQLQIDGTFTILAILLSVAVIAGSGAYFLKSKRQLESVAALLRK
jgi:copper transport protein